MNARASTQKMANLPKERLEADKPPFSNTGIDFFGPFEVKQGRSMVKRYGVIFTCMVSRAVHLEVAHNLTTDSFLGVFSRFTARRGKPSVVFSDNGTNLTSADKELRRMLNDLQQDEIHANMAQHQIDWRFLPPYASHTAGAWERLIQSVKKILRALIRMQTLTDESLQVFMAEAERIMIDRPLTAATDTENQPLTPAMLLQSQAKTSSLPPGLFEKKDLYTRRWWRQVQYLADVFWKRWMKEYLPNLQRRTKWKQVQKCLKVGDLVLIADEATPRGHWPMGVVEEVKRSSDDLVRSVTIRTTKGLKERSVKNIVTLEETID